MNLAKVLFLFTFLDIRIYMNTSPFIDLLCQKEHKHESVGS